jgi:hypothetical protein
MVMQIYTETFHLALTIPLRELVALAYTCWTLLAWVSGRHR